MRSKFDNWQGRGPNFIRKGRLLAFLIALVAVLLGTSWTLAQHEHERRERLDLAEDQHWLFDGPTSTNYSASTPDSSLFDEQSSFHVELKRPLGPNERAILWHGLNAPLTEGTTLKIRMSGQADHDLTIRFGVSTSVHGESVIKDIPPIPFGKERRDDFRSFEMPTAKANQYFFWFDFGKGPAKVDLSHVHLYVERIKITAEQARINARTSPAAVAHRIDSYRRGDLTVSVVDKSGRPVANAPVKIEQVRHEFPFGASTRFFNPNAKDAISHNCEKSYLDLFNAAAVPFYWKDYQSAPGAPGGTLQDAILQWCKKNQLITVAQGLVTEEGYPSWEPQIPAQIGPAIRGHILALLKKYGDKIGTWSIYSGALASIAGDEKSPFQQWVSTVKGEPGAVQRVLEWSRAASSNSRILLEVSEGNESLLDAKPVSDGSPAMEMPARMHHRFNHEHGLNAYGTARRWNHQWEKEESLRHGPRKGWKKASALADQEWSETQKSKDNFKTLIENMQANGVHIDLLGLRFNMRQMPIETGEIWKNCALLGQLQIPLQIDELAVMSGEPQNGYPPPANWPSTPNGEAEQAKQIVDTYGILFSHRSIRGIYYLNICDRDSLNHAPYGLLRSNGTQKPAYKALQNLLHHTWWTQTSGKTNDKGALTTRAFFGDYNIVVEMNGKATRVPFKFSSTSIETERTVRIVLSD